MKLKAIIHKAGTGGLITTALLAVMLTLSACNKDTVSFTGNLIVTSKMITGINLNGRIYPLQNLTIGLYDPSVGANGVYSDPIDTARFDANLRLEFKNINLGNYIIAIEADPSFHKIAQVKAGEDVEIDLYP